jgi:hypothetical protein
MGAYAYLIGGIALAIVSVVALYLYRRRRSQDGSGGTWLSYVLLWPLVVDADKSKRAGRFLTKRECVGWGVVLVLIVLAVLLSPSSRGGR